MSTAERAREYRAAKKRGDYAPAPRTEWLPWPRSAEDGTPLGVDLSEKSPDVRRIMLRHFSAPKGVDFDDYFQEVCVTIARRNHMPSAHDPRKSSFGHYVYMVANTIGADLANVEGRRREAVGEERSLPAGTGYVDDLPEVRMALDSLVVQGAIGPTAREYALTCLAGLPTAGYGVPVERAALRTEIESALLSGPRTPSRTPSGQ